MIIRKDNTTIDCSKGIYESMYKRLGYVVIEEKTVEEKEPVEVKTSTVVPTETKKEVISKKMSKRKEA